jgi:hypothetical protein
VFCAAGKPDVEAQIDAVMSRFVARANEVRNQLNSQAWSSDKALDEVRQTQSTNSATRNSLCRLVGLAPAMPNLGVTEQQLCLRQHVCGCTGILA